MRNSTISNGARSLTRRSLLRASALAATALAAPALTGCDSLLEEDSDRPRIAMVFDAPVNDGGWGSSCYEAMIGAAEECGWDTACSENVASSDWAATMQAYIDMGYDLIYCPGNEFQDAVLQVAADNPDARFCLLNGTKTADNVEAIMPDASQIGTLAGALAGLLTNTGVVGFIGGTELDTTVMKLEAYAEAAAKVNPAATCSSAYAGSFNDAAKGKEIANSMLTSNNVDVMFGDASVVDAGVREAMASFPGTFAIGQPNDLGGTDDPLVANSVVTDNAALVAECMRSVESGDFGGRTVLGDLSNGGVSIGTFSGIVSADVQQAYLDIVEQIREGSF